MNKVRVLFFATLRERAGARSAELELEPGLTVAGLKARLVEVYPRLGQGDLMQHCLASIDHEYCADETVIPEAAEVAFFPPVSGG